MQQTFMLGKLGGLTISARPNAIIGLIGLAVLLIVVGWVALDLPPVQAVIGGIAAALLHYLFELAHHLGHARAAARTGYPMLGLRYWWLLAQSIYPKDEPALPAGVHIRRALGGPMMSLALAAAAGMIALLVSPLGGLPWWLSIFSFLDNLLVFTIGAFLPLGFTDGSTLLQYWGKQ